MGKATYTVTVTNNSNGVSVDYETETPMTLLVPEVAAEVIKDLVNTVRFIRCAVKPRPSGRGYKARFST